MTTNHAKLSAAQLKALKSIGMKVIPSRAAPNSPVTHYYVDGNRIIADNLEQRLTFWPTTPEGFEGSGAFTKDELTNCCRHGTQPNLKPFELGELLPDPTIADLTTTKVAAKKLLRLLEWVSPAMSTEETRYYLRGICLHQRGTPGMVATDGHRLMKMDLPPELDTEGWPEVIIPSEAVRALMRMLAAEPTSDVELYANEGYFIAEIDGQHGSWRLSSKTVDGNFPDFERIIPSQLDEPTLVGPITPKELKRDMDLYSTNKKPTLRVAPDGTFIDNSEGDEATSTQVREDALDYEVGFNAKYIHDIATAAHRAFTSAVWIEQGKDGGSPHRIAVTAEGNPLALCMPLRLATITSVTKAETIGTPTEPTTPEPTTTAAEEKTVQEPTVTTKPTTSLNTEAQRDLTSMEAFIADTIEHTIEGASEDDTIYWQAAQVDFQKGIDRIRSLLTVQ